MAQADFTRISSNIAALNTLNSLRNINTKLGKSQLRLATGRRINQASDDPAGLTIALKMAARNGGLRAALGNIGDAKNMLAVAEGGLSQISDLLTEMQAKAVAGSSETLGTEERNAIKSQLESMARQINDIVTETTWNGNDLLGGGVSKRLQTGAGTSDFTTWNLTQGHKATETGTSGLALGTTSAGIGIALSAVTNDFAGVDTSSFDSTAGLAATGVALATSYLSELDSGTYEFKVLDKAAATATGKATADVNDADWGTIAVAAVATPVAELDSGTYRIVFTGAEGSQTMEIYDTFTGALAAADTSAADYGVGGAVNVLNTAGQTVGISIDDTGTELANGTELEFEYIAGGYSKIEMREVTVTGSTEAYTVVNVDADGTNQTGTDTTRAFFYAQEGGAYDTGRGFDVNMAAGVSTMVTGDTTRFDLTEAGGVTIDFASATDATAFSALVTTAISTTSGSLNNIGSLVSRLDSKEQSVGVQQVNTEAAYNRIMNADMAFEQVQASKYQILQQTAVAMLAQSNMAPQGILSLFR